MTIFLRSTWKIVTYRSEPFYEKRFIFLEAKYRQAPLPMLNSKGLQESRLNHGLLRTAGISL